MQQSQDAYSTLEVDNNHNFPQVAIGDLPEVNREHQLPEVIPKHAYPEVAYPNSINGQKKERSGKIASFSRIAAVNYTDKEKIEHAQVYFQDSSLDIWMTDLDVFENKWTTSLVNTTGYNPKNGTPIAAFNWVFESQTDFHVRFISDTNDKIRALWGADMLNNNNDWESAGAPDDVWTVTNDSSLGLYSPQCDQYCERTGFMIFYSQRQSYTACAFAYHSPDFNETMKNSNDNGTISIVPDRDTAYALVPIEQIEDLGDTHPWVGLYLSVGNALREFYFATGHGFIATDVNLTMTVDTGAQIAAMAYANDSLRYVQVFVTRKDGGVQMAYLDGGPDKEWTWADAVDGMENVVPLSPISATQSGRVYVLEDGDDGRQIVEFKRTSISGIPTFERLGPVNTTATKVQRG